MIEFIKMLRSKGWDAYNSEYINRVKQLGKVNLSVIPSPPASKFEEGYQYHILPCIKSNYMYIDLIQCNYELMNSEIFPTAELDGKTINLESIFVHSEEISIGLEAADAITVTYDQFRDILMNLQESNTKLISKF